ncbi:MAG TPA: phytoene/squalene synthase family protein [Verrucomicrobiae bacterium]|nr:phytoene/squalene synthase family protein [Verrucomicrobiae bacterium]
MAYGSKQLLSSLLRDVSRSFYLTLRVLPAAIRPQISLAYLLARTTDTIADTELVALDQRLAALQSLREHILGTSSRPLELGDFESHQGSAAERALLGNCESALELLRGLTAADRDLVVAVLQTITSGQELDLRRFSGASQANIIGLQTAAELDDYAYRVAGCVGEFWTRMCRAHLFASARLDDAFLLANGIRFGKGLQLVNILRDVPRDLRTGRCYFPAEQLKSHGLVPSDLLQPENEGRFRPVYDQWLEEAQAHLTAGWAYTQILPRRAARVRLACAWPLLLGARTLELLRRGRVLEPSERLKVSRGEVRGILLRSLVYYPWPRRWEGLFQRTCCHH